MNNLTKEEFILRVNQETRYQMDSIIQELRDSSDQFKIGEKADKRSPLRNVLNVATDASSSLEVIKVFIRYQAGRKEGSEVWKIYKDGRSFAEVTTDRLDQLNEDATQILKRVEVSLPDNHPLTSYFQTPEYQRDIEDLHLKLAQLYLGYLVREHTALVSQSRK